MSAEVLRRASSLMRERAELMSPPPWEVSHIDPAVCGGHIDRWFVMSDPHGVNVGPISIHEWEPSAHYAASWHPAVALAVADWLESEARALENFASDFPDAEPLTSPEALAVARAYLGESS